MRKIMALVMGLALLTAGVASAAPWPVTYQLTGTVKGSSSPSLGLTFTDAPFTFWISAEAKDVTAVTTFDPALPDDLYVAGVHPFHAGPAVSGSLAINGMFFTILNSLYVSDTQANNLQPGIFTFGTGAEGALLEVQNQFFETYRLITAVAPLTVAPVSWGYTSFAVSDSLGTIGDLTLTFDTPLEFSAMGGVPEPSTWLMFAAGLAGMLLVRLRRVH